MKKIIVASKNPVKIDSSLEGFRRMFADVEFEIEGLSIASGVSDQPMTDSETFQGAMNRVNGAMESIPDADYWIGLEGGLEEKDGVMEVSAWIIIKDGQRTGKGKTASFFLPEKTADLIRQGYELGHADDLLHKKDNSKQKSGSVGILTGEALGRTEYYVQAVILALIPFKNPHLFPIS